MMAKRWPEGGSGAREQKMSNAAFNEEEERRQEWIDYYVAQGQLDEARHSVGPAKARPPRCRNGNNRATASRGPTFSRRACLTPDELDRERDAPARRQTRGREGPPMLRRNRGPPWPRCREARPGQMVRCSTVNNICMAGQRNRSARLTLSRRWSKEERNAAGSPPCKSARPQRPKKRQSPKMNTVSKEGQVSRA